MTNAITDIMLQHAVDTIINQNGGSTNIKTRFDSHRVIQVLMRLYPQEYVTDLHAHVSATDPIMRCHAEIGKRLNTLGTIAPTRRVKSMNVRGEESENQEWEN